MRHVPLNYSINCKRNKNAGHPFLVDNISDDFVIVLIAFVLTMASPVWGLIGLICLHFSFWFIYDVGYFENDKISATIEPSSKTPPQFEKFRDVFSEPASWFYAAVLGVIGMLFISKTTDWYFADVRGGFWVSLVLWGAVLGLLRINYYVYNRVDKMTRVYLYLPLQMLKYGFPAIFIGLAPAGAALIFAQILRRWLPYIVYRYSGVLHSGLPIRGLRLLFFACGWVLLLPSNGFNSDHYLIGAAAFIVLLARAVGQLKAAVAQATGAGQDTWQADRSHSLKETK